MVTFMLAPRGRRLSNRRDGDLSRLAYLWLGFRIFELAIDNHRYIMLVQCGKPVICGAEDLHPPDVKSSLFKRFPFNACKEVLALLEVSARKPPLTLTAKMRGVSLGTVRV